VLSFVWLPCERSRRRGGECLVALLDRAEREQGDGDPSLARHVEGKGEERGSSGKACARAGGAIRWLARRASGGGRWSRAGGGRGLNVAADRCARVIVPVV
jgi:hypothetical protein